MEKKYKYFLKVGEKEKEDIENLIKSSKNAKIAKLNPAISSKTTSLVICYSERKPIGICGIAKNFYSSYIYIFVNEDHTRKGIAKNLLDIFILNSIQNEIDLYLVTRTESVYLIAYNLYLKNNFKSYLRIRDRILLIHSSVLKWNKLIIILKFILKELTRNLKLVFKNLTSS